MPAKLNPLKDTNPASFTKGIDTIADNFRIEKSRKGKRYDREVGHDD